MLAISIIDLINGRNAMKYFIKIFLVMIFTNSMYAQNYSLQLDGIDDLVLIPDSDSQLDSISNQITLEAWVYIDEWPSLYPRFIDRSDEHGSDRFILGTDNGTHSAQININGNELWSINPIQAETWTHIAGTYDGEKLRIYINGVLNNFSENIIFIDVTESDLYFGNNELNNRQFKGQIDEVRVWNIERSGVQIQSTMNDSLPSEYYATLDSGLVGYWRFDALEDLGVNSDGADDIRDFSILHNHGDTEGSPLITFIDETHKINNYSLVQNYPNPFNPNTRIRYSVPSISQVSLKIYNVLGKEIEIIVDEEKEAGTYEVNWNAANLPSGVYFYRIQSGSFVETKKMLLMK